VLFRSAVWAAPWVVSRAELKGMKMVATMVVK